MTGGKQRGQHEREHSHGHEHSHEHGHAHGGHSHEHHQHGPSHDGESEHSHDAREPLGQGAAAGKVIFFDAFSGIAGDMTIAALVDLGVSIDVVKNALAALPVGHYHLHLGRARRSGIAATSFDVHVEGSPPERTHASIDAMLAESALDAPIKALARRIFRKLGEAEASVHRIPIGEVHFHEVGAVDAIVDVVGTAAALVWLGAREIVASPLPMGHGFVRARHGVLPLPAPAVVDCLAGVPTYGVDVEAELVTPTGAAIVATVAQRFERWPAFIPERAGWGAGARELADRPNLLRVVLGHSDASATAEPTHVIVEANVDDMTGELAGHALAVLLAEGALDAWATPVVMKKGRPGLVLGALTERARGDDIAAVMLRETSTIGVRRTYADRIERPRRTVEVKTRFGLVPVKVSAGPFGAPVVKPEFDVCARLAREAGIGVREVLEAALAAAQSVDSNER